MANKIKFSVEEANKECVVLDFINTEDFNSFVNTFGVPKKEETCIQINGFNCPKPKQDSTIQLDLDELHNNYNIEPFEDSYLIGYILNPKH